MKNNISKIYFAIALILAVSACTDDFDEMNISPNNVTAAPYTSLVSNAQNSIARTYTGVNNNASWCRYNVRDVYVHEDRYSVNGSSWGFGYYNGHLKNLQVALEMAEDAEDVNSQAIIKILTAYAYQNITDWFGDIPYSEALMADTDPAIIYPKYDSQQSIYADLIVQLKAANGLINPVAQNPGSADLFFNGDMQQWKRFCNSLLLRIYMRMSLVDDATARAGIEEIIGNSSTYPIISSNDQNGFMHWLPGDPDYRSPNWLDPTQYETHERVVSEAIISFLTDRSDDRLQVYAEPAATSGLYAGLPLGTLGQNTPDLSLMGIEQFQSEDSPSRLIKYSEVMFIIAEAALNGWDVGMTAQDAYEAAIEASFNEYGLTMPGSYLTEPLVDFNGATPQRELIGDQKWLALYPIGPQGWAEVRRTGYPVYVNTTEPVESIYPGKGVIKRQAYPYNEAMDNGDNLNDALEAQPGIDTEIFGSGVWWDVN